MANPFYRKAGQELVKCLLYLSMSVSNMGNRSGIEGGDPLSAKVKDWLEHEGYPLEFETAHRFDSHGFRVFQGYHVRDVEMGTVREVDVYAKYSKRCGDSINIEVAYVVECKWSRSKPWVVFTSPLNRMAPSACITQAVASDLAHTALWCAAGDEVLCNLGSFYSPDRPGFGGRVALSKGQDQFYSSMQSVVSNAQGLASYYDDIMQRPPDRMPMSAKITFPVIVLDGDLFEACYNLRSQETELRSIAYARLHWRGAESHEHITTVDIVTIDYLSEYLAMRKPDVSKILDVLEKYVLNVQECFDEKSLSPLRVVPGSRGVIGLPPLLHGLLHTKGIEESHGRVSEDKGVENVNTDHS